jgi:hypothetical protein
MLTEIRSFSCPHIKTYAIGYIAFSLFPMISWYQCQNSNGSWTRIVGAGLAMGRARHNIALPLAKPFAETLASYLGVNTLSIDS